MTEFQLDHNNKPLVHHRSKTVLLVVHELPDVAPAAAMCAWLGDLYRHRTHFAKEPMLVLRVVVRAPLRHYFVTPTGDTITTWRAHEDCSGQGRWTTHVGAPDSIWRFEELVDAFWGRPQQSNPLSQDDGGMADLILLGNNSATSLTVWQSLAQLVQSLPSHYYNQTPPLVIFTFGSLRGVDWVSRMAFAMVPNRNREMDPKRKRPIALVGFSSPLWYCRVVSENSRINAKKIKTTLAQENSIVLMIGKRDSASTEAQDVSMIPTPGTSLVQREQVLQLLRQTLFPPATLLEIMPPSFSPQSSLPTDTRTSAKPFIYSLLWSLLQDPHMIQFPCYLAKNNHHDGPSPNKRRPTLGSLILSVLEEVLGILHRFHADWKATNDDAFCQAILHPLEQSLLSKLLGTGGDLVEDLTNNRRIEVLARLKNDSNSSLHNRWILEPLATRAALAEWQLVTQHSPYSTSHPDPVLVPQLVVEHVQFGLGLVLQLGGLLGVQSQHLKWVVERVHVSAIPLEAWGIRSMNDLYQFLVQRPPLREEGGVENATRLLSRL